MGNIYYNEDNGKILRNPSDNLVYYEGEIDWYVNNDNTIYVYRLNNLLDSGPNSMDLVSTGGTAIFQNGYFIATGSTGLVSSWDIPIFDDNTYSYSFWFKRPSIPYIPTPNTIYHSVLNFYDDDSVLYSISNYLGRYSESTEYMYVNHQNNKALVHNYRPLQDVWNFCAVTRNNNTEVIYTGVTGGNAQLSAYRTDMYEQDLSDLDRVLIGINSVGGWCFDGALSSFIAENVYWTQTRVDQIIALGPYFDAEYI